MLTPQHICDGLSDQEIVRKSLEAVDFFSCLYERYEERLLRYIKRVAFAGADEAADILQDAFIKIWKNLNAYDQSLPWSSWMYRIVHNEAISSLRRKKTVGRGQQVPWDERLFSGIPDDVLPEDATEPELPDKNIHQVLALLPESYREVLVLRFWENMPYDAISDILKIPEGTVATRINRAKKAFRAMVKNNIRH
ncbi:MAG: sigma-70 family RNA polymerase sigma factor [Saprospirales bacterium]|nr:sigma-70 family RNA polymerase sigma factor [Saprospirales bacterium]